MQVQKNPFDFPNYWFNFELKLENVELIMLNTPERREIFDMFQLLDNLSTPTKFTGRETDEPRL